MLECYIFYLETGNLYVTSADQSITFNGQEYMAVPLQREKYTANSDSKIDDCQLHIENCDDRGLGFDLGVLGLHLYIHSTTLRDFINNKIIKIKRVPWNENYEVFRKDKKAKC